MIGHFRFMINHIVTEKVYVMDASLKVCFEASNNESSCLLEFTILEDTRIEYPICNASSSLDTLPFGGKKFTCNFI